MTEQTRAERRREERELEKMGGQKKFPWEWAVLVAIIVIAVLGLVTFLIRNNDEGRAGGQTDGVVYIEEAKKNFAKVCKEKAKSIPNLNTRVTSGGKEIVITCEELLRDGYYKN